MKMMPDLIQYLEQSNIQTKIYEHEPLFTVEQAKYLVEKIPGAHCKNLFLIDDQNNLWLVVAVYTTCVDLKELAKILKVKKLRFANVALLQKHLGLLPGSVTPLGIINDESNKINIILDAALLNFEWMNIHPLVNTATMSIRVDDLIRFIKLLQHQFLIVNF